MGAGGTAGEGHKAGSGAPPRPCQTLDRRSPALWPRHPPPPSPAPLRPPPRPPCTQGFIRPASRGILLSSSDPAQLLDALEQYQPPPSLIHLASQGKLLPHERG